MSWKSAQRYSRCLSTDRRTNWRRDMATLVDTLLQTVAAKAPKQMSNAVSTLPKARRISEHVHPANYSPDQDIRLCCLGGLPVGWAVRNSETLSSVWGGTGRPHVSLATGNEEIISHDIFLIQRCTLLVSHTRAIANPPSPLPRFTQTIFRYQQTARSPTLWAIADFQLTSSLFRLDERLLLITSSLDTCHLCSTVKNIFTHYKKLFTYVHTYIHTYTHIYIHTYTHTHTHTHTRVHTYIHTHTNTYIHTDTRTYIHTQINTYIHTCMHTYRHKYIHTRIHTHT